MAPHAGHRADLEGRPTFVPLEPRAVHCPLALLNEGVGAGEMSQGLAGPLLFSGSNPWQDQGAGAALPTASQPTALSSQGPSRLQIRVVYLTVSFLLHTLGRTQVYQVVAPKSTLCACDLDPRG